jgi:hypothetical protein
MRPLGWELITVLVLVAATPVAVALQSERFGLVLTWAILIAAPLIILSAALRVVGLVIENAVARGVRRANAQKRTTSA